MVDQPKGWQKGISRIEAAIAALEALPTVCAQAYATTKWSAKPIVDRHFTAGNAQRYDWPSLAWSTIMEKMGGATESNKDARKKGWTGTKAINVMGMSTLPMLVRTGNLRNAILTTAEIIKTGPESVRIMWTVPNYAHWHIEGGTKAGRPPIRNFIQPNADDKQDVRDAGQRFIDQAIGQGRISFALAS